MPIIKPQFIWTEPPPFRRKVKPLLNWYQRLIVFLVVCGVTTSAAAFVAFKEASKSHNFQPAQVWINALFGFCFGMVMLRLVYLIPWLITRSGSKVRLFKETIVWSNGIEFMIYPYEKMKTFALEKVETPQGERKALVLNQLDDTRVVFGLDKDVPVDDLKKFLSRQIGCEE